MKTMEVLAPAGSYDALIAAVNAGADAVYCGGNRFGARAYAENFTEEQLLAAMDYAHLKGAKVYLTVNTCLKNRELEELPAYLMPYYRAGLDAVLVQDFGVLSLIREDFPDLPVHASTQMNITSAHGASFLQSLGLQRVVLARELSLKEIHTIHESTPIELEVFVHGALCYSYSGQCLMSSMFGGRSGNRGRCAGTCRLPYQLDWQQKPGYPLSLKDLCAASFLPALQEAGVRSLKIEGRMKSVSYTAGVTKIYRELVDLLEENGAEAYAVSKEQRERLLAYGNRSGFTNGFFEIRNDPGMLTKDSPSHHKETAQTEQDAFGKGKDDGKLLSRQKLPIIGEAVFSIGRPMQLTIGLGERTVLQTGAVCEKATNRPTSEKELREKLLATGDTVFSFERLTLTADRDVFVPLRELKKLRRNALIKMQEELLKDKRRDTAAEIRINNGEISSPKQLCEETHPVMPTTVAALVSLREQLAPVLKASQITTVILDSFLYERNGFCAKLKQDIDTCHENGKHVVYAMPYIIRQENAAFYESIREHFLALPLDGILVRDYDGMGLLDAFSYPKDKIRLDAGLYTYSDKAGDAFSDLGYVHQTLPVELNEKELLHRSAAHTAWVVYGRLPLMVTANCIHKTAHGCDHKKTETLLIDRRKKVFPVRSDCTDCTNLILNADILDLTAEKEMMKRLCPEEIRYQFTTEDAKETAQVLRGERSGQGEKNAYTRGHFKRGVE